uniref:Uncharacterized protein n=1 Tax=Anguilla anguilla TaxID=7936 RepID=A0A0E9TEY5_ANGAN
MKTAADQGLSSFFGHIVQL